MEKLFTKTTDNVKIAFNLYKKGHRNVVIICPGWFMTKDSKAFSKLAKDLSEYYDIISMDFRGHGKSGGFYTFTAKELLDLDAVIEFAQKNYDKINLIGFSLGGAAVLIYGAQNSNISRIIAVSPPCDFNKIENKMWHPNAWIPTLKKFEPARWLSVRPSPIVRKKIKPIDIINKIEVPTLFVAGARDVTVCPWHTKKLYEKTTCPKKLEIFENGIHAEDLFLAEPERFLNLCLDWLEKDFSVSLI